MTLRFWQMRGVVPSVILSLGLSAPAAGAAFVGTVDPVSFAAWKAFRAAQKFQTQVIAISSPTTTGARTLIISEPPPKATWERITELVAPYTSGCAIREWHVMSGGAVGDVVCTLKKDLGEEWPDALARLQRLLYGTAEGAPVVALPVPARRMIAHNLDVRFGGRDLFNWLTERNPQFRSSPIAPAVSLRDILNGAARGVFRNDGGTLVLWVIDRGGYLTAAAEADIRRFAVASDLVLGAVASATAVAIVGRGRVETFAHLPPLRSETVMLLAGTPTNSLAQSYERNDMLAGKGSDGVDRAPILLSPQLVDTEFGTLLNVADQLLKGWSMAGRVSYLRFDYPKPKSYPFGTKSAPDADKQRGSFLFNWNTDGAAYRQAIEGLDVVVPQRSGALSVIYGDPVDRPRGLENIAYDYFATSGDTTLARVVQYTLLYQIFRQFDVRAPKTAVSPRYARFQVNVHSATQRQLKYVLADLGEKELGEAIAEYWLGYVKRIPDGAIPQGVKSKEDLLVTAFENSIAVALALRKAEEDSKGAVSSALAEIASYMRRGGSPSSEFGLRAAYQTLAAHLTEEQLRLLLKDEAQALRTTALLQVAAEKLSTWDQLKTTTTTIPVWNRTAYIVESAGRGQEAVGVGGHNLDAPLLRFRENSALPGGRISVERDANGQWIVTHSAQDAAKARELARQVGTRKALTKEQIEAEVAEVLKKAPAAPPVALASIRNVTGKTQEFASLPSRESAYEIRRLTEGQQKLLVELSAAKQEAIVVEQLADGSFVLSRTGSMEALHVASVTAATDALASGLVRSAGGKGGVSVYFNGVRGEKAEAMVAFVQSNVRRYPKETVDHLLSAGTSERIAARPALLNARVAHNGLRVEHSQIRVTPVLSGKWKGYSRVEVPITVRAKTPLLLRIVLYMRDATTATVQALANKIAAIVATLKGPASVADVRIAIRRQLEADMKALHVDALLMRVENDAAGKVHDIYIGADERSWARAA